MPRAECASTAGLPHASTGATQFADRFVSQAGLLSRTEPVEMLDGKSSKKGGSPDLMMLRGVLVFNLDIKCQPTDPVSFTERRLVTTSCLWLISYPLECFLVELSTHTLPPPLRFLGQ